VRDCYSLRRMVPAALVGLDEWFASWAVLEMMRLRPDKRSVTLKCGLGVRKFSTIIRPSALCGNP